MQNDGQAEANSTAARVPRFDLNGWWWTMLVSGFLIIFLFGFCFCIESASPKAGGGSWFHGSLKFMAPTESAHCAAHWRSWEMGAVIWSILFGIYYIARLPEPQGATIKKVFLLIVLAATVPNILAALFIFFFKPVLWHVGAVIFGGILFMSADYWLYNKLCKVAPKEPTPAGTFNHEREKRLYLESLLVADMPMVTGLFALLLYLLAHYGQQEHDMEAFAGGAISFQLIAANVIFVLSQGGFIRWVWESHEPPDHYGLTIEPSNIWVGPALMCGLFGAVVPFLRLFDYSKKPWLGRVELFVLIAAFSAAALGLRKAKRLNGGGKGLANTALALGLLGAAFWGYLTPPCGMFSGEKLVKLPDPDSGGARVSALALTPDGSELARGSDTDQTVKIINTATGQPNPIPSLPHGGPVLSLAFSADGQMLASGGRDMKVMLWDAETGQLLRTLSDNRHADVLCLAFSPDGALLAAGGSDGTVYLWDTQGEAAEPGGRDRAPKLRLAHENAVRALAFSVDGKWLAGGGEANIVLLWGIEKYRRVGDGEDKRKSDKIETAELFRFGGFGSRAVFSLAVSQDGKLVAAGFNDGSVRLWERTDQRTWDKPKEMMNGDRGRPVLALLFSDDAKILAGASANPGVVLWDTESRQPIRTLDAAQAATKIAFSQDGRAVASGSLDGGTLSVWRPE